MMVYENSRLKMRILFLVKGAMNFEQIFLFSTHRSTKGNLSENVKVL